MLTLLRLVSIRHQFLSPLRTAFTVLGVAVGVATLIDIAGKADFSISAGDTGFDEERLETVKTFPGVQHAAGSLTIVAPVMGSPRERLYVMGVDLIDDGFFR